MTATRLGSMAEHETVLALERERERLRWSLSSPVEPEQAAELALKHALLERMAEVEAALRPEGRSNERDEADPEGRLALTDHDQYFGRL